MKRNFSGFDKGVVTPARLMSAINQAVTYGSASNEQIKGWLEAEKSSEVINEICELIKQNVDEKTWEKIKI